MGSERWSEVDDAEVMKRRSFFSRLLQSAAAITVASAVECFGVVKLPKADDFFAQDSARLVDKIFTLSLHQGRISALLKKGPIPEGMGFN